MRGKISTARMRAPWTVVSGGMMLLLAACSAGPQNCDPSQTDLFSGVGCMSSGGYRQRAMALQSDSTNAQADAILAREKAIKAEHEASDAQARAQNMSASANARMAALESRTDAVQAQALRLQKNQAQLIQKKKKLEGQLRAAQQKLAAAQADPSGNAEEIQRINKQISDLQAQSKTLPDLAQNGG